MSQRKFSVMVVPEHWEGDRTTLASRLAPMTSQSPQQLERAMERGAFAFETDLSHDEADRVWRRLERLDLPLRITDDDGTIVRASGQPNDASASTTGDGPASAHEAEPSNSVLGEEAEAIESSLRTAISTSDNLEPVEVDADDISGGEETSAQLEPLRPDEASDDDVRLPALGDSGGDSDEKSDDTSADDTDDSHEENDAWSDMLGDSVSNSSGSGPSSLPEEERHRASSEPVRSETASLDAYPERDISSDHSSDEDVAELSANPSDFSPSSPTDQLDEASDAPTPSDNSRASIDSSPSNEDDTSFHSSASEDSSPEREVRRSTSTSPDEGHEGLAPTAEAQGPIDPALDSASSSEPPTSSEDTSTTSSDDDFNSTRMTEALTETAGSADKPYKPDSFDDRPTHIPALAALLSAIAPGAGQIYNGQSDKGWEYGWRALLVLPWFEGIRQAYRRAEAIRTYEAPPPDEGSLKRALLHVPLWCGGVASLVLLSLGSLRLVQSLREPPDTPSTESARAVGAAIGSAEFELQRARIRARSKAIDNREPEKQRFTMSDNKRAQRLFRIGYKHCRALKYEMCASSMKRVSQLSDPLRHKAISLQAWASSQRNADLPRKPMPDFDLPSSIDVETSSSDGESSVRTRSPNRDAESTSSERSDERSSLPPREVDSAR